MTGCQGTEALAFARRKRSSGPFASGLTPQDRRDDLQLAAAVRAVLQAQLSRTGRWCAQFASHSAGGAARAAGSGYCGTSGTSGTSGTTSARSLAEFVEDGASTPWKRIRCSRGRGTSDQRAPLDRPCRQPLHKLQWRHDQVRDARRARAS